MRLVLYAAFIGGSLFFVPGRPAFGQVPCAAGAKPAITVTFEEGDIDFDVMKDREKLAGKGGEISPDVLTYGGVEVGGLMEGGLSLSHQAHYQRYIVPETAEAGEPQGCVRFNEIAVTVHIDPKIYIAQEVQDDSCMTQEIYRHELKHIEKDRTLFPLYRSRIEDALALVFTRPDDYVSGIVPLAAMDKEVDEMNASIAGALNVVVKLLGAERMEAQKEIDSFDEYLRLSIACSSSME